MFVFLAFMMVVASLRCSAKLPSIPLVTDEVQLGIDDYIFTNKDRDSHIYRFHDWPLIVRDGSNLHVFGVNGTEPFTLHLYPNISKMQPDSVTGEKPKCISLTKWHQGWDVEYPFQKQSYKDTTSLPGNKFVWFIMETTNNYMAVYRLGEAKPVVVVSNYVLKSRLNFNEFQWYSLSSTNNALWDFRGFTFDGEKKREMPSNPFLQAAAQNVRKAYKKVSNFLGSCEYATSRKVYSSVEEINIFWSYINTNCMKPKLSSKYHDMLNRYGTILKVAGTALPEPPTKAKLEEYVLKRKSMKV